MGHSAPPGHLAVAPVPPEENIVDRMVPPVAGGGPVQPTQHLQHRREGLTPRGVGDGVSIPHRGFLRRFCLQVLCCGGGGPLQRFCSVLCASFSVATALGGWGVAGRLRAGELVGGGVGGGPGPRGRAGYCRWAHARRGGRGVPASVECQDGCGAPPGPPPARHSRLLSRAGGVLCSSLSLPLQCPAHPARRGVLGRLPPPCPWVPSLSLVLCPFALLRPPTLFVPFALSAAPPPFPFSRPCPALSPSAPFPPLPSNPWRRYPAPAPPFCAPQSV